MQPLDPFFAHESRGFLLFLPRLAGHNGHGPQETSRILAMEKQAQSRKPSRLAVAMRTDHDYQWCAQRLKALADPDRLRIVTCLLAGPKNVSQLTADLGEEMVKVSHHLGVLRHAAVVETTRQGKFVIYRLHPEIAAATRSAAGRQTLDLGCCRLDLANHRRQR